MRTGHSARHVLPETDYGLIKVAMSARAAASYEPMAQSSMLRGRWDVLHHSICLTRLPKPTPTSRSAWASRLVLPQQQWRVVLRTCRQGVTRWWWRAGGSRLADITTRLSESM